ncbi:CoA transferase subunit A [Chloroflexota bacterium]
MNKVWDSAEEAIADIQDGARIAVAGFLTAGVPRILLRALAANGTKNLSLLCGCGPLLGDPEILEMLVKNKQLKRVIDSYGLYRSASKGEKDPFEQAVKAGEIELRVYPMGTLAERYRAAAAGIPAFYTPTGVGSVVEDIIVSSLKEIRRKKETRIFNGERYVLEYSLKPDYAFVHAHTGDREGNLKYKATSINFNPVMAAASRITIAEVENLVEPGEIPPDFVHTPGIYVNRVVKVPRPTFNITIDQ